MPGASILKISGYVSHCQHPWDTWFLEAGGLSGTEMRGCRGLWRSGVSCRGVHAWKVKWWELA